MSDGQQVVVLGGGVIGAMSAWYLQEAGYRVTIVDQGRFGAGCSHGNCGYVCPSHVLPLPAPGAVSGTLKTMFRRNSPFKIKWRFAPGLWYWFWRFLRHCNRADMLTTAAAKHGLLQSSMTLYQDLIGSENLQCEWEPRGLLFVFQSPRHYEEYAQTDKLLKEEFGLIAKPYDGRELAKLEPALKEGLGGAWHYVGDCHLRPDKLMSELKSKLLARGVAIRENVKAAGFRAEGGKAVALLTDAGEIPAARFVVATGAWTPFLNQALGCKIPIQPGKGYSVTMSRPQRCPKIPLIFEEHRVAVTPLRTSYRLGSTMEFAGYDASLNRRRLQLLYDAAELYLHESRTETVEEEWYGWRPMTWDGKPIIDRSPAYSNVYIAAGHNMLGLSMAPATGKLIQELIAGDRPHLDVAPFSATRF